MGIIWKFKFWLMFRISFWRARLYDCNHPFSNEKQDALSVRLDYLIFQALASASITTQHNLLVNLTHWPIVLRTVHETILESYPVFYQKHLNEFKVIANLADTLRNECHSLIRLEEHRFKEPILNHPNVNRIYALCRDLYDLYLALYDGSFDEDCVEIMNEDEKRFYYTSFILIRMETLSRSDVEHLCVV